MGGRLPLGPAQLALRLPPPLLGFGPPARSVERGHRSAPGPECDEAGDAARDGPRTVKGRHTWPLSQQSPVTRMHWAVTCAGTARRPGVRSDPDRVTLMIHDSERVGEATDKEITSHTKMYLANRPSAVDTSTLSTVVQESLSLGSCPATARVCAVGKAGSVPRLPTATGRCARPWVLT